MEPTPAILDRYHVLNRQQWELLEEGKLTRSQVLIRRFDLLFSELGIACSSQEVCKVYERFLSQGHFFYTRRSGAAGEHLFKIRFVSCQ